MNLLIFLFVAVVGISFLCSILESVLLSISFSSISALEQKSSESGRVLKKVKEDMDSSISSILILNTFANTLGATAIGVVAKDVYGGESNFVLGVSVALTFAILFFSEIIPKTLGAVYAKELAPKAGYIIRFFTKITYPIIFLTQFVTKKLSSGKEIDEISKDELIHSMLMGSKQGIIGQRSSDIVGHVLELDKFKLSDIYTPRTVMYYIYSGVKIKELLEVEDTYKFSRVPVFDKDQDKFVGLIYTKNLFKQAIKKPDIKVEELMKPITSLNLNIPVSKAIDKFITKKEHMFLVCDNYDLSVGIVTLEDCIETLLGIEIMDESDTIDDMQQLAKLKKHKTLMKNRKRKIAN